MSITWSSFAGKQYQVQANNDLSTTNWFNLGSVMNAQSTSTTASITETNKVGQFYRIAQLN